MTWDIPLLPSFRFPWICGLVVAGGAIPQIHEGCGDAGTLAGEGFSPAASSRLEICPLKCQVSPDTAVPVLNIYQVSKGQDQGTDPSAQADVGGQFPSQHREKTLPHLLSPSQRLWCCHAAKNPSLSQEVLAWIPGGRMRIGRGLGIADCTHASLCTFCCIQHHGAAAG